MNMNNEIITSIFFKENKKKRISGRADTMSAMMPYLIMNVVCQMHYKYISRLGCCHNLKKISHNWGSSYTNFNHAMLCLYNDAQKDYIIDKMDSFENYTKDCVEETDELIQKGLCSEGVPYEDRKVISTCLLCNVLSESAQVLWRNTYLDSKGREESNMDIDRITRATIMFADEYYKPMKNIDPNKFKGMKDQIDKLCHTMIEWISYDVKVEKKNKPKICSWAVWKHHHDCKDLPRNRRGLAIRETLEKFGYDIIYDRMEVGLFDDDTPQHMTEIAVQSQECVDVGAYEYVFYGSQAKKKGRSDSLVVYRKKKEVMV